MSDAADIAEPALPDMESHLMRNAAGAALMLGAVIVVGMCVSANGAHAVPVYVPGAPVRLAADGANMRLVILMPGVTITAYRTCPVHVSVIALGMRHAANAAVMRGIEVVLALGGAHHTLARGRVVNVPRRYMPADIAQMRTVVLVVGMLERAYRARSVRIRVILRGVRISAYLTLMRRIEYMPFVDMTAYTARTAVVQMIGYNVRHAADGAHVRYIIFVIGMDERAYRAFPAVVQMIGYDVRHAADGARVRYVVNVVANLPAHSAFARRAVVDMTGSGEAARFTCMRTDKSMRALRAAKRADARCGIVDVLGDCKAAFIAGVISAVIVFALRAAHDAFSRFRIVIMSSRRFSALRTCVRTGIYMRTFMITYRTYPVLRIHMRGRRIGHAAYSTYVTDVVRMFRMLAAADYARSGCVHMTGVFMRFTAYCA